MQDAENLAELSNHRDLALTDCRQSRWRTLFCVDQACPGWRVPCPIDRTLLT
jgi:hypothetical protein